MFLKYFSLVFALVSNDNVMQKLFVLLSSLFRNTRAFFYFWFNKIITQKATQKLVLFLIHYRKLGTNQWEMLNAKNQLIWSTCKKHDKMPARFLPQGLHMRVST